MKYEYDGFVIDLKDVLHMRKTDFTRDNDCGLRLVIQLRNEERIILEAIMKYTRIDDKVVVSDYPLQKLRKLYNTFKNFEETTVIDRIIIREGNTEKINEIIVRK